MQHEFDKHFTQHEKLMKRAFNIGFGLWIVWTLFILALIGGGVYVVWYFLSKP